MVQGHNPDKMLAGKEGTLKVRLTHLRGAGSIIAFTMAHILGGELTEAAMVQKLRHSTCIPNFGVPECSTPKAGVSCMMAPILGGEPWLHHSACTASFWG